MAHLFIATVDALMVPYRSVNGVVLAGLPGQAFPLVVGANTVEVRVTAPDLITAKISTITVTRLAANPLPAVSIAGASVIEGNGGATNLIVPVTLGAPSAKRVTAHYRLLPGTALPGVVFGYAGVTLGDGGVVVSGSVGAAVEKPGANPTRDGKAEVAIGDGARVQSGRVVGDTVRLRLGASVADLFFNNLLSMGAAVSGTLFQGIPLPVLSLPTLPAAAPGGADVDVKKTQPVTLTPGAYGAVLVRADAVLTLAPGVYHLRALDVRGGGRVQASGAVEVRVQGTADFAAAAYLGPSAGSGVTAAAVRLQVEGAGASGIHARFERDSIVRANVPAPKGALALRQGVQATGAFIGNTVQTGPNVRLTLESGFLP